MVRKLGISVISILGIMSLVVSAQQPAPVNRFRGNGQEHRVSQAFPGANPAPEMPQPLYPAPTNVFGYQALQMAGPMNREDIELLRKSESLVKQFAKAEGADREKIKTELTDLLNKQFDTRQKRQEKELAALEAQVKKLRDLVQKRQENRRDIISKRLEQLVREAEGLGW